AGKVDLVDPENKNLAFHSEQARRTTDGLELTKPLKFQDIQPEDSKTEAAKPKVSAKPFSRVDSGALYLAFSAKGISDGKQHYLLS
uniref:hypothetical protein n=1 Tax=Mesomycoplasma ovipneumoniae TaxID=29562 RepID=UPI0031195D70